jgi:hypothetical protein
VGQKVRKVEGEKEGVQKGDLKASIPGVQTTFHQLHNIRHFDKFTADSIHLKKPSGGRRPNRSPMPWGVLVFS